MDQRAQYLQLLREGMHLSVEHLVRHRRRLNLRKDVLRASPVRHDPRECNGFNTRRRCEVEIDCANRLGYDEPNRDVSLRGCDYPVVRVSNATNSTTKANRPGR